MSFLLVQAKTASNFSGEHIGSFVDGVEEFFSESPTLPMNENIKNARSIMQVVYDNSLKFKRAKPSCRLHYVTTGQWMNDAYLRAKLEKGVDSLRKLGLFSNVSFTPMGADEIHASYQRSKNSVTAEFVFSNKVLLPEIAGVNEAYLGILPATEFLKLIADGSGNIRKSLFTDNVRDFQDYNPVNLEIQKTLRDEVAVGRFVVLNNGVTIVTRELDTTRDKVAMADYQIVNGCQTSHVLFDERDSLTSNVHIPVKLIATQDEDVISSIITATNSQTLVTAEDLYALGAFAKKLEAFLSAYGDKKKLFYERRSKQYSAVPGIEKVRIVTKWQVIRSFAAMFLDEPHRATGYYAELQNQVGSQGRIFNESHKLEPYYTAAYAYYRLEYLFRNGGIPVYYKPVRFHLLMAVRYVIAGDGMPTLGANKVQSYCNNICETLWDNTKATEAFKRAADAIEAATGDASLTYDLAKTRALSDTVKAYIVGG